MHTIVMKNRVEYVHYLYNDHEKQGSMGISMLASMDLFVGVFLSFISSNFFGLALIEFNFF